ncbi:MAG: hypothetical protein K8E66_06610, partial [Phycisphaerales bacterium]|nr:hypothetical protein [Phycisphaerales bacterium]
MNTTSLFACPVLLVSIAAASPHSTAGRPQQAPLDWRALEAGRLSGYVQLTSRADYLKAGEAYFNANASWIIFQATPVPAEGAEANPNYEMYAAPLERDASGAVTGLGDEIVMLSNPGSANTCGWWHPTDLGTVLFGS